MVSVVSQLLTYQRVWLCANLRWFDLDPEDGPVLVTIKYRIAPEHARDFIQAMPAMRLIRRRDGAIRWGLFRDTAYLGRYLETFVAASWAEHLRQHERLTVADHEIENRVRAFHTGDNPPTVSHLISAYTGKEALRNHEA